MKNDNGNHHRRGERGLAAVMAAACCVAFGVTAAAHAQGAVVSAGAEAGTAGAVAYTPAAPRPPASEVGRSANDWLALQRENRAAAPTQPVLGDVATLVYQRYLDSFKNKIPATMGSALNAAGASGGGQSSAQ